MPTAQLALAWLLAKGKQLGVTVIPIPGTKREKYLIENMGALKVRSSLAGVTFMMATDAHA
jgi:aryl-alcohol dehydrogenase-like predicted oxidoreductase